MAIYEGRLKKTDYYVEPVSIADARLLIEEHHYAKGSSRTAVFVHGLFHWTGELVGVVQWLPPTKPAAVSVCPEQWEKVLSLSRMVVVPNTPKNACSFLVGASVRAIRKDARFKALVTYADDRQGHDGLVYRSCNFIYFGETKPTRAWIDPQTGRQVAILSTKSRTTQQMKDLGYKMIGSFKKHKFVMYLDYGLQRKYGEL